MERIVRDFALQLTGARCRCASELSGTWVEDKSRGDTLCAFVTPLGVPRVVCPLIDAIRTTLTISCDADGLGVTIVDKTTFSSANETHVRFDGEEMERTTRGGRKKFMLSGGCEAAAATVTCRLFQRGDGWLTKQVREVMPDGNTLRERNILQRPDSPDVVVDRFFTRKK